MIIDKDFYGDSVPYKLSELIKKVQTLFPDLYHSNSILEDFLIESCATIQEANKQDLVFIENPKYIKYLENIKVGCIVIDPKHSTLVNNKNSFLICKMPRRVFAFCLGLISPGNHLPASKSKISRNATIKKGVILGDNVSIGKGVIIGENTVIGNGVIIDENSEVGSNCTINYAHIGKSSLIYPGARIGTTGFGFNFDDNGVYKFPHRGRVIIKNNVEVGANTTIDRGSLGDTIIDDNVMIDNLVHIAHNVCIGKGTIICGQSGIAGSTVIGENVILGAQVGIAGHLKIKSGVMLSARSGVTKDINKVGLMGGFPAVPIMQYRKQKATINRITKQYNKKKK